MVTGNNMIDLGRGETVMPVFAGSEVKIGDLVYFHDDTGVRYARPFSDDVIENVAVVQAAFVGYALSAGKGDDGDSVTVKHDGTGKLTVTDGSSLVGQQVEPDLTAGAGQPIGRNSVTIGATNPIGRVAQSSLKADAFVKFTGSVLNSA